MTHDAMDAGAMPSDVAAAGAMASDATSRVAMASDIATYENFVSLGSSCVMAATMEVYGIRGWAGPFDWVVSPSLTEVLRLMDSGFDSFLRWDALEPVAGEPGFFLDRSCGLTFKHEGDLADRATYLKVRERYARRIARFEEETTRPTCFLRSVKDPSGLVGITEAADAIGTAIRRGNERNDLVFLIAAGIPVEDSFPFRHFCIGGSATSTGRVDESRDFVRFCLAHYDLRRVARNLAFARRHGRRERVLHVLAGESVSSTA